MVRSIVPKQENSPTSPGGPSPSSNQKAAKRRCVPSACVPCRKRKSKCDGATPDCATCVAVYKTECFYDAEGEGRRKTAFKRDRDTPKTDRTSAAETIIACIKSLPDAEVLDLIQQIRAEDDIEALAESLRRTADGTPLSHASSAALPPIDLSAMMTKSEALNSGVTRVWGHTAGLGLVMEDDKDTGHHSPATTRTCATWTRVTEDKDFVVELLDYYFAWSNSFYQICSKKHFYESFHSGNSKYCSPLLVNAICSFGCHFSDRPEARSNPNNPRTAGDHFFEEARKLLHQNEAPCLTTVQALAIMSIREPSAGRDSSGFMYAGTSLRMALEMGLHLTLPDDLNIDPVEDEIRCLTFWGCFTMDTVWSLCIGRISQLPKAAITVRKPRLEDPLGIEEAWRPKPDAPHLKLESFPEAKVGRQHLHHLSLLSELVNDTVFMFYAPRERFTSRKLLDHYAKYKAWYRNLPKCLQLQEGGANIASVLVLHMFYHTCVLHLFKPIMRMDLTTSAIVPREICLNCANEVSKLMNIMRKVYGLRRVNLTLTHICLSSGMVHLTNMGDRTSAQNLVQCLKDLEAISTTHFFGARAFKIICSLAKRNNVVIPVEALSDSRLLQECGMAHLSPTNVKPYLSRVAAAASNTVSVPAPPEPRGQPSNAPTSHFQAAAPPPTNITHNVAAKQVMQSSSPPLTQTGCSTSESIQYAIHSLPSQNTLSPDSVVTDQSANNPPAYTQPTSVQPQQPLGDLFWGPLGFAGQGVPITGTSNVSPMDIPNLLENIDGIEQLHRDGFKLSTDWYPYQESAFGSEHISSEAKPQGATGDSASYGVGVGASLQGGHWYNA